MPSPSDVPGRQRTSAKSHTSLGPRSGSGPRTSSSAARVIHALWSYPVWGVSGSSAVPTTVIVVGSVPTAHGVSDLHSEVAHRLRREGDLVETTRRPTRQHHQIQPSVDRLRPERRCGDAVHLDGADPHRVERARDRGSSPSWFSTSGSSGPDAEASPASQTMPERCGAVHRAADPRPEREAPDDPEHTHDRADERGPDRYRSATAAGLDREPRADDERGRQPGPRGPRPGGRRSPVAVGFTRSRSATTTVTTAAANVADGHREDGEAEDQPVGVDADVDVVAAGAPDREPRRERDRDDDARPPTPIDRRRSTAGTTIATIMSRRLGADRPPRRHVGRARR